MQTYFLWDGFYLDTFLCQNVRDATTKQHHPLLIFTRHFLCVFFLFTFSYFLSLSLSCIFYQYPSLSSYFCLFPSFISFYIPLFLIFSFILLYIFLPLPFCLLFCFCLSLLRVIFVLLFTWSVLICLSVFILYLEITLVVYKHPNKLYQRIISQKCGKIFRFFRC